MRLRKGITPVIAIVLLLLITVGAVGVVYTQFQNIVGEDGPDTSFLDEVEVNLQGVTRNSSSLSTIGYDTMVISLENNGDREYNMENVTRLEYSIAGENRIRVIGDGADDTLFGGEFNVTDVSDQTEYCLGEMDGAEADAFGPGDIAQCNTGVEMPEPGNPITVYLVEQGSGDVVDSQTCDPSTSDSTTC